MKKLSKILCLAWLMMLSTSMIANDISVSNVSLEGQDLTDHFCYVEFDVAWDNSWRTTSIPYNWDAAWVFIKFSAGNGPWGHASIHSTDFAAATGSTMSMPTDSVGVFIYRDADGTGSNNFQNIRLRWEYGADGVADDASIEVRVFAIEMVYIPEGDFYLGDGAAVYRFHKNPTTTDPYLVTSGLITIGVGTDQLTATGNVGAGIGGPLSASYPVGYDAFYCMKYEVSQEQYVDFLNTLSRDEQKNRVETDVSGDFLPMSEEFVMSAQDVPLFANGITCSSSGNGTTDPITFTHDYSNNTIHNEATDGQNIACNYLSWMDIAAYSDWAGLRPISEPEFEKVCRGTNNPVANEFAWGNASIHSTDYTMTNRGSANEQITNMGVNVGNALYSSTDQNFQGPGRCGIFAASATNATRMETGASYYGVMEMSGNLWEVTVCLFNQAGKSYTGLEGDGVLDYRGFANTDYWPGIDSNYQVGSANGVYSSAGVVHAAGIAHRGGYHNNFYDYCEVSDRQNAYNPTPLLSRESYGGGRMVRTAP